jgi:phospholipase C
MRTSTLTKGACVTGSDDGGQPSDVSTDDDQHTASRRQFLSRAGKVAAGVAIAGFTGGVIAASIAEEQPDENQVQAEYPDLPPRHKPGFDHLVVIMYENRSFDNLLGYLYDKDSLPAGQQFDGLNFGDYSNRDNAGNVIPAHPYGGSTDRVMQQPSPDPGEEYPHVNTQLFNVVDPPGNAFQHSSNMLPPFNAPPDGTRPNMQGFVRDYINDLRGKAAGEEPVPAEYDVVMGSFTPAMLPVFATLATQFAVYDNWHCAVPSQTFCNRSFFHASTSHGFVTNNGQGGYSKWLRSSNTAPTIFNRLEEAGIPWRVYFDDRQLISLTGLLHAPVIQQYWHTNFRTMTEFYDDAEKGNLPAYSFIEPRLLYDHNDMHPPGPLVSEEVVGGNLATGAGISDARAGDAFLHSVYKAVRSSASHTGSNALNTMLLVTFDEHGGTYDHVPPPAAEVPEKRAHTEMGFSFDRLGVRVPAIAISAYTARGRVINDPMHHSSVVSTLTTKHGLRPLNARDRGAPTLDNAVHLSQPRQPSTWPNTRPSYVPANPEADDPVPNGDDDRALSPPGVGLTGLLTAHYGAAGQPIPQTYRQAFDLVTRSGLGLFG